MNNGMENKKPYKAFLIPHTHWDREWYLTFQQFRIRLLDMIDNLLEVLEQDEEFSDFNFDGQTIMLEDYLEVYPAKKDLLKKYISANRIQVGPWYILPDEFLVSGEATVRNLLLGHMIAREFGRVMKVGYLPDPFGHISQMPQILQGFGIDNIIFWRGIEYEKSGGNEFIWQGADGTEVLAVHLPRVGYCNARSLPEDEDQAFEQISTAIADLRARETSKAFLLLNGVDHLEAQSHIPSLISAIKDRFDDLELVQGNLEEYIVYVKQTQFREYQRLTGEFRSGRDMMVLNGVYSSRMYLKQMNDRCQVLLESWAEPTSTIAAVMGKKYQRNLVWLSWKWLLKNHPHDSISGCSVDQVHREMVTRFDWSRQISEEITSINLEYISSRIKIAGLNDDELALVLFNPLPYKRTENIRVKLEFNKNINFHRIKVCSAAGEEIPSQLIVRGSDQRMLLNKFDTPRFNKVKYAIISFTASDIPACGYQTCYIKGTADRKMPGKYITDIRYGGSYIENEFYKITADKDGTIDIYDKINHQVFQGCNRFVDSGDAGDEYTYSPPLEDEIIYGQLSDTSICNPGDAEVTLRISGEMLLPEGLKKDRQGRKEKKIKCPLETRITLYSNVQRVDIKTKFKNYVRDHRLRVEFPSGIKTEHVYAAGQFNVIKRAINTPDSKGWVEKAYQTAHNSGFVDLNDGKSGLALLNKGLPEYEVIPEKNTFALTLLRSVGWLSVEELEYRHREAGPCLPTPEAQCQGEHVFSYALIPHRGSWEENSLGRKTAGYKTGVMTRQITNQQGTLPENMSLFELDKPLEISALKKHEWEEKYVLRVYNPTGKKINASISLNFNGNVFLGEMNEKVREQVSINGGKINLLFNPGEIKTLIFDEITLINRGGKCR